VPDVELETPDIDDVDHDAPAFKRWLALIVVLVTLFGATVAYLQSSASNKEDNAAREAARASIDGLGRQVESSTEYRYNYRAFVESKLVEQRAQIDRSLQRAAPAGDPIASLYSSSAARWEAIQKSTADLSPLIADPQFGEAADPTLGALADELDIPPTNARLTHSVQASESNDYGSKADQYVAVLTLLAAALFLFGLSLTINGRGRFVLAGAGALLTVLSVGATMYVFVRPVHHVSASAVDLAAHGSALTRQGKYDEGIDKLDQAIDDSPRFADAYGLRAQAEFLKGSPQASLGFVSIVDPASLEASTKDLQKAYDLGDTNDLNIVGDLGFQYFLQGDNAKASSLTHEALDLNDSQPELWFNLGLIELARGREQSAANAYTNGLTRADDVTSSTREDLISAAFVDLGLLTDRVPDTAGAAQVQKGRLAQYIARKDGDHGQDVPDSAPGASATDFSAKRDGVFVNDTYSTSSVDAGTPIENIWYYRSAGDQPFQQTAQLRQLVVADDPSSVFTTVSNGQCLPAGDYRLEVYAGSTLLGTDSLTVDASSLGGDFVNEDEGAQGFSLCRPTDWKSSFDDTTASVFIVAPDASASVGIQVVPSSVEFRSGNPDAIVSASLQELFASSGGTSQNGVQDDVLSGATPENAFVSLPAKTMFATLPDGSAAAFTVSFGPDGVLRSVLVLAKDLDAVQAIRDDMTSSLSFSRVVTK